VAHELQHLRQGDITWEILLELLKPVFFLNPVFHVWKKQVEELRELSCDSEVLRRGRINISDYCETLLSVCQKRLRRDRAFLIAFPKVTLVTADRVSEYGERKNLLSRRIISLFEAKKTLQTKTTTVMFMVPLVVFLSVVTIAIQKSGDWSQDRLMLSTVVNLERLETINAMSAVPNF
jgi:beta-lactamase regulating signal transducer with metallopeptidase domain